MSVDQALRYLKLLDKWLQLLFIGCLPEFADEMNLIEAELVRLEGGVVDAL